MISRWRDHSEEAVEEKGEKEEDPNHEGQKDASDDDAKDQP